MLANALYLIFFVAFSGFMANRLYVGISKKCIQVKGVTYSREREPIMYWIVMILAVWGILVGLAMCAAGITEALSR